MAIQQNRPRPPLFAFLIALIFACALTASGWGILTANSNCLIFSVLASLTTIWPWVNAGQDMLKRAMPVLCLAITLVAGRILWTSLSGFWFVFILLLGGIALLSYLFLKRYLNSLVELLWALSLPAHIQFLQSETWRMLLYTREPLTSDLIWPIVIGKLQRDGSAEAVKLLANVVSNHPDQQARLLALQVLDQLTDKAAIDALCDVWAVTRHKDLAELLIRKQWRASAPPETLTLSALLLGEVGFLRGSKAELIPPLAQACQDGDSLLAERAGQVLRGLENVEAREALCRVLIEQKNPPALAAALSTGYLPREEQQRALFLFMTEQWERYASHDFDRRLMHQAYLTSPEPFRQRIREKLRALGRMDFLPILAGEGSEERTAQFNASESEVLIQTLIANRDWQTLWSRTFDLSFQWSVRAVNALAQSDWKPADGEDQALFTELAALADGLPTEQAELRKLLPPALLQTTARVPGRINAVCFAPVHPTLAIGTGQKRLVLWNYQTAQCERVLRNFEHSIGEVAFSPEETLFCAEHTNGPAPCSIYAFTDAWKDIEPFRLGTHTGTVTALAPISGSRVLSAGNDRNVILWDVSARKEICRREVNDWARNMQASPDGTQVLLLRRGLDLLSLPDMENIARVGKSSVLRCAAFAPDSLSIFVGTSSGQLLVYRKDPEQSNLLVAEKDPVTIYKPTERLEAVEVLKQLSAVASVGTEGEIRFFSLDEYTPLGSVTVPDGQVTSLNISPDEAFLAVGSAEAKLTLWDLRSLNVRLLLERPFAQATVTVLPTLNAMLSHSNLTERAQQVLKFAQIILRHRLRYTIEIDEAPSLALGEFDIEID